MDSRLNIDALVADLKPVRRIRPREGLAIVGAALALMIGFVALRYGFRADILAGAPHPMVVIRGGMLALLGIATASAAVAAARPAVGQGHNGWLWALAGAALLPFAAIVLYLYHRATGTPFPSEAFDFHYAKSCFRIGLTGALGIGAALTFWLRRGAPTALDRAGWLVGLAAGSFGVFAYSLHCPSESIYYIGIFYTAVVAISAGLGRLIVPKLLRW